MENNREMGWPLGLGSMYMRLRMAERFPVPVPHRRSFLYSRSSSFSSFSTSSLDTESTISFFQDKSKTLGRLMGLKPRNRRSETQVRNLVDYHPMEPRERRLERSFSEIQDDMGSCHRICIPMCFPTKTNSRKIVTD